MTLTATLATIFFYTLFCLIIAFGAGDFDKHKDKY